MICYKVLYLACYFLNSPIFLCLKLFLWFTFMQCLWQIEGNGANIGQRKAASRWLCFCGEEAEGYAPLNQRAGLSAKKADYILDSIDSKNESYCLPLCLTTEYYTLNSSQHDFPNQEKLEDPQLYHYALFSDNVLAAAVVVNSTITHAKVIFTLDILAISFNC